MRSWLRRFCGKRDCKGHGLGRVRFSLSLSLFFDLGCSSISFFLWLLEDCFSKKKIYILYILGWFFLGEEFKLVRQCICMCMYVLLVLSEA